jgi:cbb3-type cytochrome oxidase maturation protein
MSDFFFLIPVALALGVAGLAAFLWSLRNGQYDDLDGAAERILFDDDAPLGPGRTGKRGEEPPAKGR